MAFGSKISLKNTGYGGGLLHSHIQKYPEGSGQQQVTCYHHQDGNNHWIVTKVREDASTDEEIRFLTDGDVIRLIHNQTGRNLHSHQIKAPLTTSQYEVSGYGDLAQGDVNDEWIVEIVSEISNHPKNGRVRSLTTNFRLRHRVLQCLLTAENKNLPEWGFKQVEVTCDKRNRTKSEHSIWNIEQHWNDRLGPGTPGQYKSRFWKDFWHLNVAMMTSNNALTPDQDKEDLLVSNPSQWPLLAVGIRICGWDDDKYKFYLLGNPVVWWLSAASIVVFIATFAFYIIRHQRKYQDITPCKL